MLYCSITGKLAHMHSEYRSLTGLGNLAFSVNTIDYEEYKDWYGCYHRFYTFSNLTTICAFFNYRWDNYGIY